MLSFAADENFYVRATYINGQNLLRRVCREIMRNGGVEERLGVIHDYGLYIVVLSAKLVIIADLRHGKT